MTTAATPTRDLAQLLLGSRNADGGWGYYAGKASRLEPTCWALLALSNVPDARQQGTRTLSLWPATGKVLLEHAGGHPNFAFHALALLTLRAFGVSHNTGDAALIDGLLSVKGIQLEQSPVFRQDNSLQAWPWVPEAFSWVEPTSWALLALKKYPLPQAAQRITEGERLLLDRACPSGGWNFGNSKVFDSELPPYVPTTALALLALQDRRSVAAVDSALGFLERDALGESSSMALSLAVLALAAFGRPVPVLVGALERQLSTTAEIGSLLGLAMGLYALRQIKEPDGAFRI
jgi:hypothetical protein